MVVMMVTMRTTADDYGEDGDQDAADDGDDGNDDEDGNDDDAGRKTSNTL